jgi:hypothetical protein
MPVNKIEAWIITAGLLLVMHVIPTRVYWLAILVLIGVPAALLMTAHGVARAACQGAAPVSEPQLAINDGRLDSSLDH